MENNTSCVSDNTLYNITISGTLTCACKNSYYGPTCEYYNPWQEPLKLTGSVYQTVVAALIVSWFIFKLIILARTKKLAFNLSLVAMLLNLLANLILVSYIWIPQDLIHVTNDDLFIVMVFAIVLVYSPIVLWLASTSLLVGFWFEVLTRKIDKSVVATKTKILVIASSITIIVLAIIGMVVAVTNLSLILVGVVLIFLPLIIDVIITTVIAIRTIRLSNDGMSENNLKKKNWVARILVSICAIWLFDIVILFCSLVMGYTTAKYYTGIVTFVFDISQGVISILLMLLFDYKLSLITCLTGRHVHMDTTETVTTKSGNTPRTAKQLVNADV